MALIGSPFTKRLIALVIAVSVLLLINDAGDVTATQNGSIAVTAAKSVTATCRYRTKEMTLAYYNALAAGDTDVEVAV